MRLLVLGAHGRLGSAICAAAPQYLDEHAGLGREDCDVTDARRVSACLSEFSPDVVINCACSHFADEAEREPAASARVTEIGARLVAEVCEELGVTNAFISSDFVFDGSQRVPYSDADGSLIVRGRAANDYGAQKAFAEAIMWRPDGAYYIFRLASLFGGDGKRKTFVDRMIEQARANENVRVVCDVFMSPTYVVDAARHILEIVTEPKPFGVYHVSNEGVASWYELAKWIYEYIGSEGIVEPIIRRESGNVARRAIYTSMTSSKVIRSNWRYALQQYLRSRNIYLGDQDASWAASVSVNP